MGGKRYRRNTDHGSLKQIVSLSQSKTSGWGWGGFTKSRLRLETTEESQSVQEVGDKWRIPPVKLLNQRQCQKHYGDKRNEEDLSVTKLLSTASPRRLGEAGIKPCSKRKVFAACDDPSGHDVCCRRPGASHRESKVHTAVYVSVSAWPVK